MLILVLIVLLTLNIINKLRFVNAVTLPSVIDYSRRAYLPLSNLTASINETSKNNK